MVAVIEHQRATVTASRRAPVSKLMDGAVTEGIRFGFESERHEHGAVGDTTEGQ